MDEIIFDLINEIREEKLSNEKKYSHVMLLELQASFNKMLRNSLSRLESDKRIKTGDTINDRYIEIT